MGRIETFQIWIPYCREERTVHVYLPACYEQKQNERFPVIYMHDGQNIFEDKGAFGGCSWGIKETLECMEEQGKIEGIIVVGIENNGDRRFEDYSPWKNTMEKTTFPAGSHGGDGEEYAAFAAGELRERINETYRTLTDAEHTYVCGSSMGGFISAYMMVRYPEIYGGAGIFSLASWFAEEIFLSEIKRRGVNKKQRYFVQVGTEETSDTENTCMPQIYLNNSIHYVKALWEQNLSADHIYFGVGVGDTHSERCWRKYMEAMFLFLVETKAAERNIG